VPQVALVGYTNAGKSTIMNQLVERYGDRPEKKVLEKDMLFATLETSVRTIDNGKNKPFLLTDTVGFIHKLPHDLVKAFRSTLEEVRYADLLIQVIDYSDSHYRQQMEVTAETLKSLEAGDIPMIYVYNKSDRVDVELHPQVKQLPQVREQQIYMSAVNDIGMEELVEMILSRVYADHQVCTFLIPYTDGGVVSYFCSNATVLEQEFREEGVFLRVECFRQDALRYKKFQV
jgi:GTP-binding protein HflX